MSGPQASPDEPPLSPSSDEPAVSPSSGEEMASDEQAPRSGLRNPAAAVRGVGAGTLAIEALVLLLAIVPLAKLGGSRTGPAIALVVSLAVLCALLAGLLRYRWVWYAGVAVQAALLVGGLLNLALAALGVLFAAAWGYVLHVRRTVLSG